MAKFIKEFFASIPKQEMSNMVTNYIKILILQRLYQIIIVYLQRKKEVVMAQFRGDDPNSPLVKKMNDFISNKISYYMKTDGEQILINIYVIKQIQEDLLNLDHLKDYAHIKLKNYVTHHMIGIKLRIRMMEHMLHIMMIKHHTNIH